MGSGRVSGVEWWRALVWSGGEWWSLWWGVVGSLVGSGRVSGVEWWRALVGSGGVSGGE